MTTRASDPRQAPSAEDTLRVLTEVVNQLSLAERLEDIERAVPPAARSLTGADGATFVLSEGDLCHYRNEDAIAPLWKVSASRSQPASAAGPFSPRARWR